MIQNHLTFLQPTSTYRALIVLDEIGRNPKSTQSMLAQKAGVVPAMVNNYIKDFVRKGYVSLSGNKTRNVTYRLTVEGEREKFNLLLTYFKESVSIYKNAKEGLKTRLLDFKDENIGTVIFYGAADTAELAWNAAEEIGLEVLGIVDSDPAKQGTPFMGMTILEPHMITDLTPDAVVISSFGYQDEIYNEIKELEEKGIKVRKLSA